MTTTATLPALKYLQSRPQWVCWKRETRKGELTKVPYNASTSKLAESDNPATWASYEQAKETLEKYPQDYEGIGYVFNDDITGIDLDHCKDEQGNIDTWAQRYINLFNSYSEESPSSTGIHILIFGLLPQKLVKEITKRPGTRRGIPGQRHEKAAIEIYCQGRFFTVTENHLPGTPITIEDRQEQLLTLHAELTEPKAKQKKDTSRPTNEPLNDDELITKAKSAKNGTKFASLWLGNTTGYTSPSEADQALCSMLAFWTGRDAWKMDSLFRRSGLYREEKWDRAARAGETYGEGTIREAIEHCTEIYTRQTPRSDSGSSNEKQSGKPEFFLEGQLIEQEQKALTLLAGANADNPKLFMYLSTVSKVEKDEIGNPIILQLDRARIRHELSDAADFFIWKKEKDYLVKTEAHPPKDLADQLLALAPSIWPLPSLKTIVEAPVLRPDGSILDKPGYDEATRLYYVPSPGMERCKIPNNPTKEDAIAAMNFLKLIFADFPFESEHDRANTLALLFTPFVRHAVKKDIQMALIDATNAGTGKGLIANIVSIAATGKTTTPMTAKKDDDEWRKAILTELLSGPRIVIIDNIRGILESQAIELILTGDGINERILGQSKSAKPKNEATWIATGNNLLIGGDLARRCYRIRMISPTAKPEERTDFAIPELEQWIHDHRPEIVIAILTVARAWYVDGKPKPENVPTLGTFTDWAKTVGGMLEFAGVEGFQGNRNELRSRNNEEASEWEAFLSVWYETYEEGWKTTSELVEKIAPKNENLQQPSANPFFEALPQHLKKALAEKPNSFNVTLSIQLAKRVQTVYGIDAFRIERMKDEHTKASLWRIVRKVAEGNTAPRRDENFSTPSSDCDDSSRNSACSEGPDNPTQPSASENDNHHNGTYKQSSNGFTGSTIDDFMNGHENRVAEGLGIQCEICHRKEAVSLWAGGKAYCADCKRKEQEAQV